MDTMLQALFCRNAKAAMKSRGLTQSSLGRLMGVSPQYVYLYVSGRHCPGLDVIERFANSLDVPADWLISETDISERLGELVAA